MKYWIDTDPGVDDAIAIFLASSCLGRDIVGFSSVQGNFIEPITARNLMRIISKIKTDNKLLNDWKPIVYRGSQKALAGPPYRKSDYSGSDYHGKDGLADVNWIVKATCNKHIKPAADAIVEAAHKFPGMALFCIGPLTNIALALQLDSNLPEFISEITIMGGSINVRGNETNTAEFNFIADPEAAKIVFDAKFSNLKLIPIDPCYDVKFFLSDVNRMKDKGSSTSKSIVELTNVWREKLNSGKGIAVYDAVALLVTLYPELAVWEFLSISIDVNEYRGKVNYSKTKDINSNVRVAIKIQDRKAFFNKLENLL